MKNIQKVLLLNLLFVIMTSACAPNQLFGSTPTPTKIPTLTPTLTPTPIPTPTPITATFGDVCNYVSKKISLAGYISVPGVIPTGFSVYVLNFNDGYAKPLFVLVSVGDGKNQVKQLEDGYYESDFSILTDDGEEVGNDSFVIITGNVEEIAAPEDNPSYPYSCKIRVEKIVAATE